MSDQYVGGSASQRISKLAEKLAYNVKDDAESLASMTGVPRLFGVQATNPGAISDKRILDDIKTKIHNTPGYSWRNTNMSIPGAVVQLANVSFSKNNRGHYRFNNPNNIIARGLRLIEEDAYVVHSDMLDKLSTVCAIFVFLATMMLFYMSTNLHASRKYVFDNPDDAQNPDKVKMLHELNSGWMASYILPLAYVTTGITFWRIFKRTTDPINKIVNPYGRSVGRVMTMAKINVGAVNPSEGSMNSSSEPVGRMTTIGVRPGDRVHPFSNE